MRAWLRRHRSDVWLGVVILAGLLLLVVASAETAVDLQERGWVRGWGG